MVVGLSVIIHSVQPVGEPMVTKRKRYRESEFTKARTRRLIQEGAILEKVLPKVRTIELSVLEDYLIQKLPQHD